MLKIALLGVLLTQANNGGLLPRPTPESLMTQECHRQMGYCNTVIYQLELNGKALSNGDFTLEECQELLVKIEPGVLLSTPGAELECVGYDVRREAT